MTYFLGPAEDGWGTWDYRNWIWTGGNDLVEEGHWVWLDGTDVEKDGFTIPWRPVAGGDNAAYISGTTGQHALAISRSACDRVLIGIFSHPEKSSWIFYY